MRIDSWIGDLTAVGVPGIVAAVVLWILGTVLTGYLLGLGIWAAMPTGAKNLLRGHERPLE